MGKKLKYCSSCEEGFAERFTFCPDCGGSLQTVEMNPIGDGVVANAEEAKFETQHSVVTEAAPVAEEPHSPVQPTEPVLFVDNAPTEQPHSAVQPTEPILFVDNTPTEEPHIEPVHEEEPEHIIEATAAGSYFEAPSTAAFSVPSEPVVEPSTYHYIPDDSFHVTVIEEKNTKQRNGLLLGSTVFMITIMLSATVYSLFGKDINISSIGGDNAFFSIPDIDPVAIDVEKDQPEKPKNDKAGGGGGGGNKEEDPASKGATPAMFKNPDIAPSSHMDRVTDPTLTQRVGVNGPDRPLTDPSQHYGLPNGADKLSDGPGSGTGIGTGRGGGVGSGNGSGLGSGSGGGAGSGTGGGIGDGTGTGGDAPPPPKGETVALNITAKPRANYTDAARQANIQGVVRLKVTFLANGQIGPISAVSGLPNGLTEQAIAAAKAMRFTPKKINGVPVAVARVVEYTFTIY